MAIKNNFLIMISDCNRQIIYKKKMNYRKMS